MTAKPSIAVIGAGGHAKVVIDVLRAIGWQVAVCLVTEGQPLGAELCNGVPVQVTDNAASWLRACGMADAFIAVGDNAAREHLSLNLAAEKIAIPSAIDPHAVLAPSVEVGAGALIMPGVVINADARIGQGAIINTGACIDHDCQVGDFAHIAPAAALAGNVSVGRLSLCGIGSRFIPGVRLGERVTVGAGAVVTRDLHDGVRVVGVPARRL